MRRALALLLLVSAACGAPAPAPPPELKTVQELPDLDGLPPLLESSFTPGKTVDTHLDLLSWRRAELLTLFAHYLYGPVRAEITLDRVEEVARAEGIDGLPVDYLEHRLTLSTGDALHLALFLPRGASAPPAILGPNKCGNHSLVVDARVRASAAYSACGADPDETRGARATLWPLERIAAAGFALATFHESELAPDDPDRFTEGVLDEDLGPVDGRTISAWALGNLRALDFLEDSGLVSRVAVYGHSRRGKTALWSAAHDPRFAAVIAHQSGTGGASLIRNELGETVQLITLVYPHWFNEVFPTFQELEARLPVDAHQLIALSAPRPVLLVDGEDDFWADPQGAVDAAAAAAPAFALFGAPPPEHQLRPGTHSVEPEDWDRFLVFLGERLSPGE